MPEAEGAQAFASQSADEVGDSQGEGPHGGRGHRGAKDPAAFIKRLDTNGDGKLAVAEMPERMREHMSGADSDKDGFVSAEELKAAKGKGAHGGRWHGGAKDPAAMMQRLDANGDGKIAVAELPEKMRERMGAADTDKDGFVSKEEMKAKAEQRGKERFAKKDANGDGALTESEVGEEFWAHMKVADSNGDAQITLAELQEARASGKLHGMRHGHGEERRGDERRGGPEE